MTTVLQPWSNGMAGAKLSTGGGTIGNGGRNDAGPFCRQECGGCFSLLLIRDVNIAATAHLTLNMCRRSHTNLGAVVKWTQEELLVRNGMSNQHAKMVAVNL